MNKTLKQARQQLGLPLEVAARKAAVSLRCWWLWERWGFPPKRRAVAEKIARFLGTTPEELGYGQPEQEVSQP